MEIQSGLLRIDLEYIIVRGKNILYGLYGPYFLVGSPYMDRTVHIFWKKVHIWTVSQSISGRKSVQRLGEAHVDD